MLDLRARRLYRTAVAAAWATCIAFAGAGVAQAGPLFASDVLEDGLMTIDTTSGAGSFVGVYGATFGAVGGLAFDGNTNTLYGIDSTLSRLVTIDQVTGAATTIGGTATTTSSHSGLAFDPNSNTLYWANPTLGVQGVPQLFTLDTSTGLPTLIGNFTSGIAIVGLAFDRNTNTLFGVSGLDGAANDSLYTINPGTAALSPVGSNLGFNGESAGLAFDADSNTLYWGDETTDSLYTVDTASGLATLVGPFGLSGPNNNAGRFVRGLAFESTGAPEPATLALLALGLAGLGLGRRRKAKNRHCPGALPG